MPGVFAFWKDVLDATQRTFCWNQEEQLRGICKIPGWEGGEGVGSSMNWERQWKQEKKDTGGR